MTTNSGCFKKLTCFGLFSNNKNNQNDSAANDQSLPGDSVGVKSADQRPDDGKN